MDKNHPNMPVDTYPARLRIDYPEKLCRVSTLLRLFYIIPLFLLLALISGFGLSSDNGWVHVVTGPGLLFLGPMMLILIRQKYPRWWFNWNLEFTRLTTRISSYLFLLRDEYPSTDQQQAVHLDLDYPEAEKLNRFLPLIKWFLAIPHYLILLVLTIAVLASVVIAWIAILITGRYPRGIFDFVVGYLRWGVRVNAYALMMITDKYPPFSLKE